MKKKKITTPPRISTGELEARALPAWWAPDPDMVGEDGKPLELSEERKEARVKALREHEGRLKPKPILKGKKIEFDEASGIITVGSSRSHPLKKGSNMAQLCKAVFDPSIKPGEWLDETAIVDTFYRGKRSQRSFYDAISAVNEVLEKITGVEEVLEYDASRVRTRVELFE